MKARHIFIGNIIPYNSENGVFILTEKMIEDIKNKAFLIDSGIRNSLEEITFKRIENEQMFKREYFGEFTPENEPIVKRNWDCRFDSVSDAAKYFAGKSMTPIFKTI